MSQYKSGGKKWRNIRLGATVHPIVKKTAIYHAQTCSYWLIYYLLYIPKSKVSDLHRSTQTHDQTGRVRPGVSHILKTDSLHVDLLLLVLVQVVIQIFLTK